MDAGRPRSARPGRWPAPASGPTATTSQRARRRRGGERPRALVYTRRPPAGALADAIARAGLEVEWTDSGPAAIGEAVDRNLAVCFAGVGADGDEGLDYLPCLNQADPALPLIIVAARDSVETQRRLRSHRVFYYLVEPLDLAEVQAVIAAALRGRGCAPARRKAALQA